MAHIILAINAGSSSAKVSVYSASGRAENPKQLAEAEVAGISAPPAKLTYNRGDQRIKGKELGDEIKDQESAFKYVLDHFLHDEGLPELKNKDDIHYACHRVVHGGEYNHVQVINKETYHHLEELSDLAPL